MENAELQEKWQEIIAAYRRMQEVGKKFSIMDMTSCLCLQRS